MYKASVVGIDNTGKTSVVKTLNGFDGIETIHCTNFENNSSRLARSLGRLVNRLAEYGEKHEIKPLVGFAYLSHLAPYFLEQRSKNSSKVLVSDRDPIIDTLCYSEIYLPGNCSNLVKPPLRLILEGIFDYPDLFFHLEASPEIAMGRYKERNQLHERFDLLDKLRNLFDSEIYRVGKLGIDVVKIDTDNECLEEVTDKVKYNLRKRKVI